MPEVRQKILDAPSLAAVCEDLRTKGCSIVHCHGVFDLIHIGHIRHFQAAKKLGQVLIVTLTGDQFVNKGPNRPAFPEELRAEALAALECVDYVAVNQAQSAIPMIQAIRPALYVKGSDYRDRAEKNSGNLGKEIATVRELGGDLAFTDDVQFSSSVLINRHFSSFPPHIEKFLGEVRSSTTAAGISALLDTISTYRIGVVDSLSSAATIRGEIEACGATVIERSNGATCNLLCTDRRLAHEAPLAAIIQGKSVVLEGRTRAEVWHEGKEILVYIADDSKKVPLPSSSTDDSRREVLVLCAFAIAAGASSLVAGFIGFAASSAERTPEGVITRPKLMRCVEALLKF